MKYALRILCSPEVAAGFALAGLSALTVDDAVSTAHRLHELTRQPEVGVILVEERLFEAIPAALRSQLVREALPMIVAFPSPMWVPRREGAEAYIVELLRRAIGYRVRLR